MDHQRPPASDPAAFDLETTKKLERTVLRKLDLHILPPLAFLWLANFVDRSNVGNARVARLGADLHLHGTQFNSALAVFYAAYIITEVPSNLILKKMRPNRWLPLIVVVWGLITTLSGLVQSYAGLLVVRIVLGLAEGGLLPGMVLYLSTIYTRHELQLRIGVFYASASLAGAFGGLLAAVITKLDGHAGLAGWRWIFVLEGIATVVIGITAAFVLPESIATAKFLTSEERTFAVNRFNADGANLVSASVTVELEESEKGEKGDAPHHFEATRIAQLVAEEHFEWREVRRGVFDIQTWLTGLSYLGLLVALYSFSLFLPTIVMGLGYKHTRTQLFSVPPYIPAAFLTIIIAFIADKLRHRMTFVLALLIPSIAGYIMAIVANTNSVRYAAVFLMAAGIYPAVPCILTILPNNHRGHYKRSTSTALQLAIANCGGFIATFAYTPDQAPTYRRGHSISLGCLCVSFICMSLNLTYCRWENRARREGRRGDDVSRYEKLVAEGKTTAPIGDRDPAFMYTL